MKRVLWFCLFLFVGVSCLDQPDCFRQDLNLIGISFKKMYDGKADTVSFIFASTTVTEADTTYTFYAKDATGIIVPLNYLKDNTGFAIQKLIHIFQKDTIYNDYITVGHKTKVQFVSEDCGERFVMSDLQLLSSSYDSIAIVSNTPSNPGHTNIIVYRCPRTNVMRLSFRQLYMDETDENSRGKLDARKIINITNGGIPLQADTNSTLSSVLLPLDPLHDIGSTPSTQYDFQFADGSKNSLILKYDIGAATFLNRCGTQKYFHNLDTTYNSNQFKILNIVKDTLKDPPVTNIETFKCPTTNEIKILFKQNRGSSKVTDTLFVKSLIADFAPTVNYADTATVFTLPLDPNANLTKYTFVVAKESQDTLRLQVDYKAEDLPVHQNLCPGLKKFTVITKNVANTSFYTSDITVVDPAAKFPAVNNIEVTRK